MKLSLADAGIAAVMGYGVVFVGLILLMLVVVLMGKVMHREKSPASQAVPSPAAPAAPLPEAPGSAGQVKLFDVPDKEAAMVMAVVADELGKPLNVLRFKSIKEVK